MYEQIVEDIIKIIIKKFNTQKNKKKFVQNYKLKYFL
jgi:hypothetical protein